MKVLTVKTLETMNDDLQLDIHYTLKMEHFTDYVFQDKKSAQYTATISMDDTKDAADAIIKNTTKLPEYNFILDILDMNNENIERLIVNKGVIIEKKNGNLDWKK